MEPISTTSLVISIGTALSAVAGSWGATKATLNGMKERTERIEQKIDRHVEDSQKHKIEVAERLATIETKIED